MHSVIFFLCVFGTKLRSFTTNWPCSVLYLTQSHSESEVMLVVVSPRLPAFYVAVCPVYVFLPLLSSVLCIDGSVPVIDGTVLLWCSRFNGAWQSKGKQHATRGGDLTLSRTHATSPLLHTPTSPVSLLSGPSSCTSVHANENTNRPSVISFVYDSYCYQWSW